MCYFPQINDHFDLNWLIWKRSSTHRTSISFGTTAQFRTAEVWLVFSHGTKTNFIKRKPPMETTILFSFQLQNWPKSLSKLSGRIELLKRSTINGELCPIWENCIQSGRTRESWFTSATLFIQALLIHSKSVKLLKNICQVQWQLIILCQSSKQI